jgi:hypothetical protein
MHVNLKITSAEDYFEQQGTDIAKVPKDQVRDLEKVLTAEIAVFMFRSVTGLGGYISDTMASMFKDLRDDYEMMWEPYQSYLGY